MKRLELEITGGEFVGRRFPVKDGGLRLGRSSSNDIHIPDENLSRSHCLFEPSGEFGLRVTDLASANGTYLNGKALASEPAELKACDLIEAGSVKIRVVDVDHAAPSFTSVDLGLDAKSAASSGSSPGRKRSPVATVLWVVAAILLASAAGVIMFAPQLTESKDGSAASIGSVPDDTERPSVQEVYYEKVEADSKGIFRYEMVLSPDGVLRVAVDNVPDESRHVTKSQVLDEKSRAVLNDILDFSVLREFDRDYVGVEPDPPTLESWTLKVVYDSRVRSIRIVNTQEPKAFRTIREKLEAFSKNQLGVWALQYSRGKLIELAKDSLALAQSRWDDRDVQHGNLFSAIKAFEESLFYLETVNPKPACAVAAREGLERARSVLEQRYTNQRFLADRAINLQQWATAQRELGVLLELIPDRTDDRNREAAAKLIDVEKRLKGDK